MVEQFNIMQPIAQHVKSTTTASTQEAWRIANARMRETALKDSNADKYSTHAIVKPLSRWTGWGLATSGLEQNFAQLERVHSTRVASMTDHRLEDLFVLVVTKLARDMELVVLKSARQLWADNFGRSFNMQGNKRKDRIDKGFSRGPAAEVEGEVTEQAFVAKRRKCLKEKCRSWINKNSRVERDAKISMAAAPRWTDAMELEVTFQAKKKATRLIEANIEGQTLPSDLPQDFRAMRTAYEAKETKNRLAWRAEVERRNTILTRTRPKPIKFAGRRAFVDPRMPPADLLDTVTAIKSTGMVKTTNRAVATCFVVADLNNVGQRVDWVVSLQGGFIVTPEYVHSRGSSGPMAAYVASIRDPRVLWCSPAFADNHRIIYDILIAAIARPESSWKWFHGSTGEFLEKAGKKSRVPREIHGLVTLNEKKSEAFKVLAATFTVNTFLEYVRKVDVAASCMNMCGL